MDRREFLRLGATGAGAAALIPAIGCAPEESAPTTAFSSGIASGLHSDTEVVLWTRIDPRVATPTTVNWEISASPTMSPVLQHGTAAVSAVADSCVKVLVGGVPANSKLWYRFYTGSESSPVGCARTLPHPDDATVESLKLAFASCQQFSAGWYAAWRAIADADLDAVLFLGDYIYEIGLGPLGVRYETYLPAKTLADYHARYRLYRSDDSLRAAHAAHPLVPIWDDHEVANDHDREVLAANPERGQAGHQAWFDYMPVWQSSGFDIYRSMRWGSLAELTLLDTRQYRDRHYAGSLIGYFLDERYADPNRSILGASQRQWLFDTLDAAQADDVRWKLVGNQVMFAPIRFWDLDTPEVAAAFPGLPKHAGLYSSMDSWDGFPAERDAVLEHIRSNDIRDVTFLTGDVHAFFAAELRSDFDDPASPVVVNEFTVSSISTSPGAFVEAIIEQANGGRLTVEPGFEFTDLYHNGFGMVEATPDALTVKFFACTAPLRDTPKLSATFTSLPGAPGFSTT